MKKKEKIQVELMKMSNNTSLEILEIIKKSNKIGIISHKNPDGDNISSTVSFALALRENLNKDVVAIKVDEIPEFLRFMDSISEIKTIEEHDLDLLIYVDCGDVNRPGQVGEEFRNKARYILNVDHHSTNDYFGDYNYVFPEKSSTCEIVFDLFKEMGFKISKDVASALLVGINTDTNRFLYKGSTSHTLRVAAELYDLGADVDYIYKNLYQKKNFKVEMFKNKLLNNAKFYFDNKVAIISVFLKEIEEANLTYDMIDDVVNYYRDIDGFEVSILFKELEDNTFKVSMRSKNYVNVAKLALDFNGGGHIRAAGCSFNEKYDISLNKLLKKLEMEYFNGI